MTVGDQETDKATLWTVLGYYTIASGSLLVINKFAVVQLPAPTFLLLAQLLFSALAVQAAHWAGALKLKRATSAELMHFVPVVAGFVGTIYANMKVLQYANVETFITFRCSTPLVLAFFDWALLGRQLPSARSWGALLALLLSAAGYTFFDKGFQLTAYFWLFVWYVFFVGEGVIVKNLCQTVPMDNWARVFYGNAMSVPVLAIMFAALRKEQAVVAAANWASAAVSGPLLLSCAMGVAMSHASYLLRSCAAATTAAVVGIVCKLVSVALNIAVMDQHATGVQLAFVLLGIFAAAFYRQAPLRVYQKVRITADGGGGAGGGGGGGGANGGGGGGGDAEKGGG